MSASTHTPVTGKVTSTTDSRFAFDVLRQNVPVLVNVVRRQRIDDWLSDQLNDRPVEATARLAPVLSSHDTRPPAAVTVRRGST